MNLREKIADWISGGALTEAREREAVADEICGNYRQRADMFEEYYFDYRRALSDIADMETPGANATVKRMAERAREGLE
jgi:hypothetical protein